MSSMRALEAIYDDLRRLVAHRYRRSATGRDATSIVNDAILKLARRGDLPSDREHLMALSALTVRHVIIDTVRASHALKRAGPDHRVPIEDSPDVTADRTSIRDAIDALNRLDQRTARVAALRCYHGHTVSNVARILGISRRTATKEWRVARAWLIRYLRA